jgi:5-methylcytosine-specific restriction endonuclease McrA
MGAGQSKYRRGENSANWKGGITTEHDKKRKIAGLKEWRISVYARDDYTCQHCGVRGGTLNAHHIKRFRDYPELRTELSNGITLCVECHKIETRKEMLADKDLRSRRAEAKELKKAAEEYTDEGRN